MQKIPEIPRFTTFQALKFTHSIPRRPFKKGSVPRRIGRTKGGLNSKLHAVCDGLLGRPLIMLLSEGQMSDYKGAALMLDALPPARQLLGDKGYDADWFRQALAERGITACIPSKSNRKKPIEHDRELYRQRLCLSKIKSGRIGGAARRELGDKESARPVRRHAKPAHPSPRIDACGRHCITRRRNAHGIAEYELLYPWHP
jgi:transposase